MNLLAAGYGNQRLRDSGTAESILTLEYRRISRWHQRRSQPAGHSIRGLPAGVLSLATRASMRGPISSESRMRRPHRANPRAEECDLIRRRAASQTSRS
jgi:hypothetical protein